MELSDTKIRNAKPADKEYTIADGQGLRAWCKTTAASLIRLTFSSGAIWKYRVVPFRME